MWDSKSQTHGNMKPSGSIYMFLHAVDIRLMKKENKKVRATEKYENDTDGWMADRNGKEHRRAGNGRFIYMQTIYVPYILIILGLFIFSLS